MGAKSLTARAYTLSFDSGSKNYIENVFSKDAQVQKSGGNTVAAYLYKVFKAGATSGSVATTTPVSASAGTLNLATTYANASTPSIQSQLISGARYSLFKINTRSHGSNVNDKLKIVILNVKKAGSIAGSDYGSFSVQVRQT